MLGADDVSGVQPDHVLVGGSTESWWPPGGGGAVLYIMTFADCL